MLRNHSVSLGLPAKKNFHWLTFHLKEQWEPILFWQDAILLLSQQTRRLFQLILSQRNQNRRFLTRYYEESGTYTEISCVFA